MLLANVLENRCRNIRVLNAGCSFETSVAEVRFDYDRLEGNAGAFSIENSCVAGGGYPLMLMRLDDVPIHGRVQLIKIDVEGMETKVLRGAVGCLRKHRPLVFFEVLKPGAIEDAMSLLRNANYDLYWLETDPFNADNFNGVRENIWARNELGIFAVPAERMLVLPLARAIKGTMPSLRE
jgi:FkbM family methyltransferase